MKKACPVVSRVDQLAGEIVAAAYNHPVAAAFSAIHDAGEMNRGHPVFDYSVMIVDSIDESMKTLERFRSGDLTEKTALAILERRMQRLTSPVPEPVLQAMEGIVLEPDATKYLLRPTVDVLFERIEQVVANNTRLATYMYKEEFDQHGVEADNVYRDYMWSLDSQVVEAEAARAKLRAKEIEETALVLELMQIRLLVMAPTEEIHVKLKDKTGEGQANAIFGAYNEVSTIAELSRASMAARSGNVSEQQQMVAEYLTDLVKQAGEIKEMFRERMCCFDIALIVLRQMAKDARKVAPEAKKAGAKLEKPAGLPKLYAKGSLDELTKIEGAEWKALQEANRGDPRGFWANYEAAVAVHETQKAAEASLQEARKAKLDKNEIERIKHHLLVTQVLAVSDISPGTGVIEGVFNDYLVGTDGRLTKRRKQEKP